MNESLFRPEVIEDRKTKLQGEVALWQPISAIFYCVVAVIWGIAFLVFIMTSNYAKKERVIGWAVPEGGLSQIYPAKSGVVNETYVKLGDVVHKGQIIAKVSFDLTGDAGEVAPLQRDQANSRIEELNLQADIAGGRSKIESTRISGQITSSKYKYDAEDARLLTQINSLRSKFYEDMNRLDKELEGIQNEITTMKESKGIAVKNLEIEKRTLARYEAAVKSGGVSEFQRDQQEQALLVANSQFNDLLRQITTRSNAASDIERQKSTLKVQFSSQLDEIAKQRKSLQVTYQGNILELKSQLNLVKPSELIELSQINSAKSQIKSGILDLSIQDGVMVKSPSDGIISNLNFKVGETVSSSSPIATVSPNNDSMFAELIIPTRSAGFVKKGMPLRIMIDAFPYQKYGLVDATIVEISNSALGPSEINFPIEIKEPVYRIVAKLSKSTLNIDGNKNRIVPGMLLKADVILDKRTLLDWLLEPLISTKAKWEGV